MPRFCVGLNPVSLLSFLGKPSWLLFMFVAGILVNAKTVASALNIFLVQALGSLPLTVLKQLAWTVAFVLWLVPTKLLSV